MIRRTCEVALWLGVACLTSGALYWGFLNAPESSVPALILSAVLVAATVLVGAVVAGATILLALGTSRRESVVQGARRAHWAVLAALLGVLLISAILRGDDWIFRHSGEISAWFIATVNWTDVTWIFQAESYLSVWLRWVVIPTGILAALASVLRYGVRALVSWRWIRAAWRWQTLITATAAFVLLIALPWRTGAWPTLATPPTWLEPAVAGLRLSLVGAAMLLGAAIIVVTTARATGASRRV